MGNKGPKKTMGRRKRALLFKQNLARARLRREQECFGLPGDDWLSCQVDVNKLVQRIGSKHDTVSPDDARLKKTCDLVDKELITIKIEAEPCNVKHEVFLPGLDSSVKNDDEIENNSPPDISEEWVIQKMLCRGCHAEGEFISLQATDPLEGITYEDMLANCTDIKFCPTIYLALQALCPLCCARLRDSLAILRQVRAAETRFQTLYHNNSVTVAASTSVDIHIKEEPTEESDVDCKVIGELIPEQKKTSTARKQRKGLQNGRRLPPKVLTEEYVREGVNYKCTKCDKICITLKHFIQHNKKEHLKRSWCRQCKISFETVNLKRQHKRKVHKCGVIQKKRHECNACDKKFISPYSLQSHLNGYHMLGEIVKCSSCDFECYGENKMKRHMVSHKTSRDFACRYCKKTFLRKPTLIAHERIHTGDKQKKCAECGQAFVQKASLNYHMAKHHPEVRF